MANSNYTQETNASRREAEFRYLASQIPADRQWAVMKKLIEAAFLPECRLSSQRVRSLEIFTEQLILDQEAETGQPTQA